MPEPTPEPQHVVVLGAGPAGLFAARTLLEQGFRVSVVEREEQVGGLAASEWGGANRYDFGVHHLHAGDAFIFEQVRAWMGDRLRPVEKSAKIKYGRGYRDYPLRFFDILAGIPTWTLLRCCTGMLVQSLRNRFHPREPADAEQALVQLYGRPLYEHFFRDFTARYWGRPPSELSPTFIAQRMPRLSAVDFLHRMLETVGLRARRELGAESALTRETLWYTPTGAGEIYDRLRDTLLEQGLALFLGTTPGPVQVSAGRVRGLEVRGNGRTDHLACEGLISTIPLHGLIMALQPAAPRAVRESAGELRHKPLTVVGLLVSRPQVLEALYLYFRGRCFHRLAEPKRSGMEIEPPDSTILIVELTDGEGTPEEVIEAVRSDLAAEGVVRPEEIVEAHVFRRDFAYPIFSKGFEEHRDRVGDYLAGLANLRTAGRQGSFSYPNMHQAMRMGHEAALELAEVLRADS